MPADPLLGPFRPEHDLALVGPLPEDPAAIETFNIWLYDGANDIGFNLHPHAHHGTFTGAVTIFLPDGRVLRGDTRPGSFSDPARPGNEQLRLRCQEPFHRWTYEVVDLPVLVSSREEQHTGPVPADRAPAASVDLRVDAITLAPPWDWGNLLTEEREASKGSPGLWIANRLTAGRVEGVSYRYDQALSGRGTVTVDGAELEVDGVGLRGHVRGVRIMDGFETHAWMGGAFPSGMTFGVNAMYRSDGGYHTNEGYVFKDGTFYANRVRWATPIDATADDLDEFVVELVCDELGLTRITGTDRSRLWRTFTPPMGYGRDMREPRLMSQALAEFHHAGEVGYGMDERTCWTR